MSSVPSGRASRKPRSKTLQVTGCDGRNESAQSLVELWIGGKRQSIPLTDLHDDDVAREYMQRCARVKRRKISLTQLLDLNDADRLRLIDFAVIIRPHVVLIGECEHESVLDAILNLNVGDDITRQGRFKNAALECAAISHRDSLEPACSRIKKVLTAAGVRGVRVDSLVKQARAIAERLSEPKCSSGTSVLDVLPTAPVTTKAVVPAGWILTADGIQKVGDAGGRVFAPVVLIERGRDAARGIETLTVAFLRATEWIQRVVDRGEIADCRQIIKLASAGLPVTSNNASLLVQFLAEYEVANENQLPMAEITSRLGWHRDSGLFLWGEQVITAPNAVVETPTRALRFRGASPGVDQLVSGYRAGGTLAGWIEAFQIACQYPRVLLGIYAGFVPPMLELFDWSNFVVDYAGVTTTGKTTAIRAVASIWGDPTQSNSSTGLFSWNSSQTWNERSLGLLNGLPLVLDDTKTSRFPQDVSRMVYLVTQGRGRGRGTVTGIASQDYWRSVLFSSGEQPILSFCQKDDGVRARVLQICEPPFGEQSETARLAAERITAAVTKNYGHAGPAFLAYILKRRANQSFWRNQFEEALEDLYPRTTTYVAQRMAPHFAAIIATAQVVHSCLHVPWPRTNPIAPIWDEIIKETVVADRPRAALKLAYEWAVANRERFLRSSVSAAQAPSGGWAGRWVYSVRSGHDGVPKEPDMIVFVPHVLRSVLSANDYEPESVIREWRQRGWLKTDKESRLTLKIQMKDGTVRGYAVLLSKIEHIKE